MKKLIYGIAFFATIGVTLLVACNKQKPIPDLPTETTSINEKTVGLTDLQLIDIIKGRNASYTKVEEIEEVLFDNCRLGSSVLRALIDEPRFPDYIVEEMMILSSPSNADITYLTAVRPALKITTIQTAATVDLTTSQFAVYNMNPRQIFIAKDLKQKALCADDCGESEWKGENFVILNLTSTTTPLTPAQMQGCNAGKWVCGRSTETRIVLVDGNSSIVVTKCEKNEEKCVRKVSEPK